MATKSWMFMSESVNETFGGRFAPGSDTSDAAHVRLAAAPSSPVESVFLSALPLSSSLLRSGLGSLFAEFATASEYCSMSGPRS